MKILALIIVLGGMGLAGCGLTPLEADYGHSVRQMTENQVYNPATLVRSGDAAVEGADPEMINQAVKTMRTEKIDRANVAQPLVISVNGQGAQ